MNYYNGELPPDDMLVRKFMAVDPAFGGGDYTAAPVVYQYSDGSIYIVDVVYDNGDKTVTQKLIVDAVKTYGVTAVRFECNKMTMSYKEEVERALAKKGIKINLLISTMTHPIHLLWRQTLSSVRLLQKLRFSVARGKLFMNT